MPDIYVSPPKKKKVLLKTRISNEAKKIIESVGENKNSHPLASFAALPDKVVFETQTEDEKIILLLRRHWSTNISWIMLAIVMILAPLVLKYVPILGFAPARFQLIIVVAWYLIVMAFIFEEFLIWFFNVYIVTDERIIDVDFISLTFRQITDAQIEKIQDITYKTGGLLRAVFDYGDVYVQTAGTSPEIDFLSVPKPDKVVKVLNELMIQEQQEKIEGRVR